MCWTECEFFIWTRYNSSVWALFCCYCNGSVFISRLSVSFNFTQYCNHLGTHVTWTERYNHYRACPTKSFIRIYRKKNEKEKEIKKERWKSSKTPDARPHFRMFCCPNNRCQEIYVSVFAVTFFHFFFFIFFIRLPKRKTIEMFCWTTSLSDKISNWKDGYKHTQPCVWNIDNGYQHITEPKSTVTVNDKQSSNIVEKKKK